MMEYSFTWNLPSIDAFALQLRGFEQKFTDEESALKIDAV